MKWSSLEYNSRCRRCSCRCSHWGFPVPVGAWWGPNICSSSIRRDIWKQQWTDDCGTRALLSTLGIASNLMTAGSKGCSYTRGKTHMSLVSWPSFVITEGTWVAYSVISEDWGSAVELGACLWTNSKSIRENLEYALALWHVRAKNQVWEQADGHNSRRKWVTDHIALNRKRLSVT